MRSILLCVVLLCMTTWPVLTNAVPISITQGERVTLDLKLTNVGALDLRGIRVRLDPRVNPAWVHPHELPAASLTLPARALGHRQSSVFAPLAFVVAPHAPASHQSSLRLLIRDARGRTWHRPFSIIVQPRPKASVLLPNYPNPFNPETWIPYELSESDRVEIQIYDLRGNLVRTLRLGERQPGSYVDPSQAAHWNGRNEVGERVATGLYLYRMHTDHFSAMRKMIVVK